jgi:3-hydroxybutyryl-CoA dehydrogenase
MGNGIAQVAARAGFAVVLRDVEDRFLERGLATISKNLARDVDKGRLTEEAKSEVLGRIVTTTGLDAFETVDFAVEAIVENLDSKVDLFRALDRIVRPGVVLASNTSSISITRLAAATSRPDRFIGMHFMNPVPVMKLVEIIRGLATSDETFALTKSLGERM